eukprot:3441910-Amphidinium_carterae.1
MVSNVGRKEILPGPYLVQGGTVALAEQLALAMVDTRHQSILATGLPLTNSERPRNWLEQPQVDGVPYRFKIYWKSEEGRYPLSCVQRFPDVTDQDNDEEVEHRRKMERKALFETIREKNPDECPYGNLPGGWRYTNTNPNRGPVMPDAWFSYWHDQTDVRCFRSPPAYEKTPNYYCYACHVKTTAQQPLKRCSGWWTT